MSHPVWYTRRMIIKTDMKTESTFRVTFTNHSDVFINARDEGHARRIVEKSGSIWTRAMTPIEMVIEKIELMSK